MGKSIPPMPSGLAVSIAVSHCSLLLCVVQAVGYRPMRSGLSQGEQAVRERKMDTFIQKRGVLSR